MTDELVGLRRFVEALQTGMTINVGKVDVTHREIETLRREIEHLEAVLCRVSVRGGWPAAPEDNQVRH